MTEFLIIVEVGASAHAAGYSPARRGLLVGTDLLRF
jgi:hypothetical protein